VGGEASAPQRFRSNQHHSIGLVPPEEWPKLNEDQKNQLREIIVKLRALGDARQGVGCRLTLAHRGHGGILSAMGMVDQPTTRGCLADAKSVDIRRQQLRVPKVAASSATQPPSPKRRAPQPAKTRGI
jgi:hypothetical protein